MTIKTALVLAGAGALMLGAVTFASAQTSTATAQHSPASTVSHHLSKSQIEQVQKALDQHGYKVTADGKWGKHSREATEEFQKKNHLKATGHPGPMTRKALGLSW